MRHALDPRPTESAFRPRQTRHPAHRQRTVQRLQWQTEAAINIALRNARAHALAFELAFFGVAGTVVLGGLAALAGAWWVVLIPVPGLAVLTRRAAKGERIVSRTRQRAEDAIARDPACRGLEDVRLLLEEPMACGSYRMPSHDPRITPVQQEPPRGRGRWHANP